MQTGAKTLIAGLKPQAIELKPLTYYVRQRGPATIALSRDDLLANTATQILTILRGDK